MARGRGDRSDHRSIWSAPAGALADLRRRTQHTLRNRLHRTRVTVILAGQLGASAALAWFIANDLLHRPQPVFAPIAAVITLDISIGQRFRRAVELVLGVALGIAVGDVLISMIGTGAWQLGLAVALATIFSVFVGGSAAVVAQAAASAVLIATLAPPTAGIYYTRVFDALIGGGIALAVMALLLPTNPLTVVARTAGPAYDVFALGLSGTAEALSARDADRADRALTQLNEGQAALAEFRATVPEGQETAVIAPLRWRAKGALEQYVEAAEHLDRALANARVLVRRSVTLINDQEAVPEPLPRSVAALAEATRELRWGLSKGITPHRSSDLAVQAVRVATEAYEAGLGFSGSVVVAQVRAITTDLLGAAGLSYTEANQMVRRAGGEPHPR